MSTPEENESRFRLRKEAAALREKAQALLVRTSELLTEVEARERRLATNEQDSE